jgi:hypothetical protein
VEVNLSTDRLLDGDDCCRAARRRADAVGWLRSLFLDLTLPPEATDDDLRAAVANGRLLCALLRRLLPGALLDDAATDNVGRFRAAIQRMGVPTFSAYDLERVSRLLAPRPSHGIILFIFLHRRCPLPAIHPSSVRPGGDVSCRYLHSCSKGSVLITPRRRPPQLFLPHQM